MFNQQEVQILIGGVNSPIDLDDLRRHTNYGGLYDDNHETVVMFWNVSRLSVLPQIAFSAVLMNSQVVNSFDQEQRRALLRFVTSCSRPPLLYVLCYLFRALSWSHLFFFCSVVDSRSSCPTFPSVTLARTSTAYPRRVLA
jgi:hypothetical protein